MPSVSDHSLWDLRIVSATNLLGTIWYSGISKLFRVTKTYIILSFIKVSFFWESVRLFSLFLVAFTWIAYWFNEPLLIANISKPYVFDIGTATV